MSGHIISKDSLTAAQWSGGVTTQLAIYPAGASYADRSFLWRVSTATVEAERSDFTTLSGVSRILMVLEGSLRLIYNGSREVAVGRFGQDSFSGDWHTESIGRVRDFNLMMKDGCTGSVEALELLPMFASRLHTSAGVAESDSFSDIDKASAEGKSISEVYYALTDVRLTAPDGMEIAMDSGDVYIRTCDACAFGAPNSSGFPEKLQVICNVVTPTILIKATIIHIDNLTK